MIKRTKQQLYNFQGDMELRIKPEFQLSYVKSLIKESNDIAFVPRFNLKNSEIFPDIPSNTPLKPSEEIILMAIKWGMILQIDYKGAEDDRLEGHERAIYPMVYGFSKKGKPLIRGFHLKGWSVSENKNIDKIWRLFRYDRILSITFTGSFYRIAPEGYNALDKGIYDRIAMADLDDIRNLQNQLISQNKIDNIDNLLLNKIREVKCKDLNFSVKLEDIFAGNVIQKKDAKNIRIAVCKPVSAKGQWIFLLGTHIVKGQIFKLIADGKNVGVFKAYENYMASDLSTRFKTSEMYKQPDFKLMLYVSAQ